MSNRGLLLTLGLTLAGCPTTPIGMDAGSDVGGTDTGGATDTPPSGTVSWTESAPFPTEVAYAASLILTSGSTRWLFVMGGAPVASDTIGTPSSTSYRAVINADGSLGAWEEVGPIGSAARPIPISQHGALRLTGEDLRQGIAMAGGRTAAGEVPLVLVTYVDADGALDLPWGRFDPMIATGEGQWQSAFMPFDGHALALVGGLDRMGYTARVQYAQVYLGVSVPTFTEGPPLPAPRAAHSWARVDRPSLNPDLYVIGGHNDAGSTDDILRTTRDAMDAVDGWETVGTLPGAPHGHASAIVGGQLYVLGGFEGTTITDRVRRAPIETDGHIGTFEDVTDGSLSTPLANAAVVQDGTVLYLVGGRTGAAASSTTTVAIGRF